MNAQLFSPIRNITLIYRFHANVERRLRVTGQSYRKNFGFTQTRRYNAKLHGPHRRKMELPCFEQRWLLNDIAMVFYVFIFIFMFRNNVTREKLGQNNFRRCYGFFLEVSFRKHLITTKFKILYQQLRSTLTTAFERHLTTEDFMDIGVKPAPRH